MHKLVNLPIHIQENILWVNRESRTHPWSHIEGGQDVLIVTVNNDAYAYDWIKIPHLYVQALPLFKDIDLKDSTAAAKVIKEIYITKDGVFTRVWSNQTTTISPFHVLENYQEPETIKCAPIESPPERYSL